jgi:hypothetical protein
MAPSRWNRRLQRKPAILSVLHFTASLLALIAFCAPVGVQNRNAGITVLGTVSATPLVGNRDISGVEAAPGGGVALTIANWLLSLVAGMLVLVYGHHAK